jgi:hypothetical protein
MRQLLLAFVALLAIGSPAGGQSTTPVPRGTIVHVKLLQYISSEGSQAGQLVQLEVANDVVIQNSVVISRGTPVVGWITRADAYNFKPPYWSFKLSSRGRLVFTISETRSVNGDLIRLSGPVVGTNPPRIEPMFRWQHSGEVFDAVVLGDPAASTIGRTY